MDNNLQQRVFIKLCVKNDIKGSEIMKMLQKAFGDETISKANIYKWIERFKNGRESVQDDEHTGRPATATTEQNVDKIINLIAMNRKLTHRELAKETDISHGTTQMIITKKLGFRRVANKLVPKDLNCFQKAQRVVFAKDIISTPDGNENFFKRIITGDCIWIYEYDTHNGSLDEPKSKKPRCFLSKKRVLLTLFFDYHGLVHYEFLPEDLTINSENYLSIFNRLNEAVHSKRSELCKNDSSWIFYHNDEAIYNTFRIREFFNNNNIVTIEQPPNSPDLFPIDYFLYGKFTFPLRGVHFESRDEIIDKAESALNSIAKIEFRKCFQDLLKRLHMCVDLDGDYLEGDKRDLDD